MFSSKVMKSTEAIDVLNDETLYHDDDLSLH